MHNELTNDALSDAANLLADCPQIERYLADTEGDAADAVAGWLVGDWTPARKLISRGLESAVRQAGWADVYPRRG